MKLSQFEFENRIIPLIDNDSLESSKNSCTVVIGKNGIGKSRLLSNIALSLIRTYSDKDIHYCSIANDTPKVIAVSTSPFDKFHLPKQSNKENNYRYVGMRSRGAFSNSAISLISSASQGLLEGILSKRNNRKLNAIFELLGFEPRFDMIFKTSFARKDFQKNNFENFAYIPLGSKTLDDNIHRFSTDSANIIYESSDDDKNELEDALINLNYFVENKESIIIKLDLASDDHFHYNERYHFDYNFLYSVCVLLKFEIIKLMDLRLYKRDVGLISLRRASSGEQCMLVMMLGIAGHITDGSVILIDEPEISLHPKWQEEFMKLLVTVFSQHNNCQFIIATHSPQIISNLSDENCFISSLTDAELYKSDTFHKQSSDFQLAELFYAPGIRNEYLNRKCVKALSKISLSEKLNEKDRIEIFGLIKYIPILDDSDPVKDLMLIIRDALERSGK